MLEGNYIELVVNSAALIQQATTVKNRMSENFWTVYIFWKNGTLQQADELRLKLSSYKNRRMLKIPQSYLCNISHVLK